MANIIWQTFSEQEREEYIQFLKVFGSLSGLFKDNQEGNNAKKPYLYYRNHEQLYARCFNVEDLTRKDSAFDALAHVGDKKVGVGLKTWIHTGDLTYQKVAEFNKLAPTEIRPLIDHATPEEVIAKVSKLRNERIWLDKRLYNTLEGDDIYHYITRDDNVMNIIETKYDLVQEDSLKLISSNGKTFSFTDGLRNYKFYASKSVLLEEFDASKPNIITTVPIRQFDDPFELLQTIDFTEDKTIQKVEEVIYLPLYSDVSFTVEEHSGFNAWNGKPKTKGSLTPRPVFEAYATIPSWIHRLFPRFFAIDAFNKNEIKNSDGFNLHLPDGRIIQARCTQENGKSLQTNPQSILGKWILHDVLGLGAREVLTLKRLNDLGVDSLKITKIDNENFKIDLAETYAFEKWKITLRSKLEELKKDNPRLRLPVFRDELFEAE
ncbi:NgoFVII family restriction endonuclease [Niallia circulans]|uniref:NgoFVII family restriction endonuclease n=1 Tax=Niallia circulans TaxID=1397 RepID=UPI003515BE6D